MLGAGSISREFALHHFHTNPNTVVTGVVDVDPGRAEALANDICRAKQGYVVENASLRAYTAHTVGKAPPSSFVPAKVDQYRMGCAFYGDFESALLASAREPGCEFDAVFIGTPPASHEVLIAHALSAHKHILLEKPLAASEADANGIVDAVDSAVKDFDESSGGQQCMACVTVDIGMRWNRALTVMRDLLHKEEILGPLSTLRATLRLHFLKWPRSWQEGATWVAGRRQGGPLREVGTHWIFGIQELFGTYCV